MPAVQTRAQQFGMQGGEGWGSPGEAAPGPGAPGAGALAWHGSSPALPSAFGARLLMGDEGRWRRRFIQRSVFPWPDPAGFHICTDVLSSPRLRKQRRAVCSQLPPAPAAAGAQVQRGERRGRQPKTPALASWLSPAGCHRCRACPGWLVTLV